MITLVLPNLDHEKDCLEFLHDCQNDDAEIAGISGLDRMSYETWMTRMEDLRQGMDTLDGHVPATTFLCYNQQTLIGIINIRHYLNDLLLEAGGHVGYMVRPSQRRKGYAKAMLKESLMYCKEELEIDKVLVTCSPNNEASRKTIIACGGVLENVAKNTFLGTVERYWITMED